MRHLVDAHSLIWALDDPRKLGIRATAILEDGRFSPTPAANPGSGKLR